MQIDSLYVHPLKSAAPIRLQEAELDERGIRWDRRWMIVDERGVFVTQREHPELALVRTALEHGALRLSRPGEADLRVPFEPPEGSEPTRARVWGDTCDVIRIGGEASAWLGDLLQRRVSLVFMPDDTHRQVNTSYAPTGRRVGFADGFPLLLLCRETFADLERRASEPLVIERFRPNLVVSGAEPYAEDRWARIRAGQRSLDLVKPCSRCTITTVDPRTAERGREPLRTLATYRQMAGQTWFAWNALHDGPGTLRVGDAVTVQETRPPPVFEGGGA